MEEDRSALATELLQVDTQVVVSAAAMEPLVAEESAVDTELQVAEVLAADTEPPVAEE